MDKISYLNRAISSYINYKPLLVYLSEQPVSVADLILVTGLEELALRNKLEKLYQAGLVDKEKRSKTTLFILRQDRTQAIEKLAENWFNEMFAIAV